MAKTCEKCTAVLIKCDECDASGRKWGMKCVKCNGTGYLCHMHGAYWKK